MEGELEVVRGSKQEAGKWRKEEGFQPGAAKVT